MESDEKLRLSDLIDRKELAKTFGVSAESVRRWQNEGLPFVRLGIKTFFFEQDVVAWLRGQRRTQHHNEDATT